MPKYASEAFARRIRRLERKHQTLRRGAVTVLREDGLMELAPARPRPDRLAWFIAALLAAAFIYKTWLYLWLGPVLYADQLARLEAGTAAEALLAKGMILDPVTLALSDAVTAAQSTLVDAASDMLKPVLARVWPQI